ncbi:putative ankyrin repeat protein, partial [Trichoderma atroviride IMI 206040]
DMPIAELWNSAYEKLRKENKQLIDEYETKLQESASAASDPIPNTKGDREKWMSLVLRQKMEQIQKDAWKFMFLGSEVRPAETVECVLRVIKMVNDSITATVVPSPYASLAWAGINVLLSVPASLAKQLEYVSSLIIQGRMRENLYQRRYEGKKKAVESFPGAHSEYKATLEHLYQEILRFQIQCYCYYTQGKASRLFSDFSGKNDWDGLAEDIRRQEAQMAAIDKTWRDQRYDDECAESERRYQGTILNLKTIGADISDLRKAVEDANKDRNQKELLDWLCDIDPSDMYNAARKKHKAGTSEWLIKKNAQFTSWVQSPSSFLWLHGKAGSGKSVLSSSVIYHLQREFKDDASIAVVYFYFTFSDIIRQDNDGMLASLIKQVCCHRPNIPDLVNDLGEYKKKGMRPSTEELRNSFVTTLRGFTNVYIVIDALDECPDINTQREELMETLHYVLDSNLNNLHLFCTSRQESDIKVSLCSQFSKPCRGALNITSHLQEIQDDIGKYIDSTLTNPNYSSWPIDTKAEVKKVLIEKSDGMFQYIRCQFEALQKLRNPRDIRQVLDDLPKGLDETYNRMLQGIDDQYRKSVANSLKWLAFSMKPLTVDDLAEIFIMHPYDDVVIDSTECLFNTRDVLIYFSGLIVENGGTVRLAHFSIKEFLVSSDLASSRIRQHLASTFSFSDIDAHLFIAYSCLSYLNYTSPLAIEGDEKSQSLKVYAASKCLIHLEMVPSEYWYADVIAKLVQALAIRSQTLLNIISEHFSEHFSVLSTVDNFRSARLLDLQLRPYCLTAYHGFVRLTGWLSSQAFSASKYLTQGDLNAALWYAVYGGSKEVAVLLLDRGADPNTSKTTTSDIGYEFKKYGDVLQIAASIGNVAMVNLLLDRDADINAQRWGSALQAAAKYGHLDILKLLVERGANIDGPSNEKGCVLSAAIEHDECFQFLLDSGADINRLNARGGYYGTALNAACNIVDNTIHAVQLLLDHGADVNAGGGEFGFALQTVCARSFPEMDTTTRTLAQILLDHGADVNARGSKYGTALQAACAYNPEIVHLLLEHGADINAEGGEYGTALQAALSSFDRDLDQLLLDRGADINAVGGKFGTTLQAACARNSGIVQLLLDRGADINAEGGEYGTALQAASHNDNWDLVELLLDRGANVNANGGKFGTALQAVSWDFDLDLVQLLLDRGADVNINGGRNGSCLQIACANMGSLASEDSMEMIRTLLQRGADPLMHGGDYPSPLHSAVDGFETWWIGRICFLLEHGADANLKVGELGSPLHVACAIQYDCETLPTYLKERDQKLKDRIDKQGIIMNLMTKGAETLLNKCHDIDVNAHGGIFGTALQAAAYSGQAKTVQLLLRRRDHIICNEPCGKYRSALNAAVIRAHWDIVDILLEAGAKPDCHVLQEPDEEFLARIREEHGWAAEERYKKFWEVEKGNLRLS